MINPEECKSIEEIRKGIDTIDYEIVRLLGERAKYVHYAANFKTSLESVKAEERIKRMLLKRREWAREQDISPEIIENIYRNIIDCFTTDEMEKFLEITETEKEIMIK